MSKATGKLPGFVFDSKKREVHCEVIVPRTKSRGRKRATFPAATIAEARAKWAAFREDVLAGRDVKVRTFGEYVAAHWETINARVSPAFGKIRDARLKARLLPFFGAVPMASINLALVRDFVAKLKAEPLNATTINHHTNLLRLILRDAVDRDVLAVFPIRGKMPREVEPVHRAELSDAERLAFLAAFDDAAGFGRAAGPTVVNIDPKFGGNSYEDPRVMAYYFERFQESKEFFLLALETGLRRGDLLDLRWRELGETTLRRTMRKTKREVVVPLSAEARQARATLKARHRAAGIVTDRVFDLSVSSVRRYFAIAKDVAKITRRVRFHDLRHTFGCRLGSLGAYVIAGAMGHATTRSTNRYVRPSGEAMEAVAAALDATSIRSAANSTANFAPLASVPEKGAK